MRNKFEIFGPIALTTTYTVNLVAPAAAGAGAVGYTATAPFIIIRHIHIANKGATQETFRLYKGATGGNAAGTELFFNKPVPVGDVYDWYGMLKLEGANGFLVGGASANTVLVFEAEGEIGLV